MSRDLSTGVGTALDQTVIEPFFAVDLHFSSQELNLWSGLGDQSINGKTYTGAGNLLTITDIEETAEISARGCELVMTGIPSEVIALALGENYQHRKAVLYMGVATDLSDMTEIFAGHMDTMDIDESANNCAIRLTVENKFVKLERALVRRYNSAYQKSVYPGDKGFDFVEDIQDKKIYWGRKGE